MSDHPIYDNCFRCKKPVSDAEWNKHCISVCDACRSFYFLIESPGLPAPSPMEPATQSVRRIQIVNFDDELGATTVKENSYFDLVMPCSPKTSWVLSYPSFVELLGKQIMETQCIFSFKTGIYSNDGFIYAFSVDNMGVPVRPHSIRWIGLAVRNGLH